MARSAHAYVRGSTVKFYEWLENPEARHVTGRAGGLDLRRLPRRQSRPGCRGGGRVAIQIRDLDQTVIGNPAHDIIRLALSLATASRGSDLPA